jgi:hypothetical protein
LLLRMQPEHVIIDYADPSTRGPRLLDELIERMTPVASLCLWVLIYIAIALWVVALATLLIVLIIG